MGTQNYLTKNVNFRLAIEHAINYTQMLDEFLSFNGTVLGQLMVGPVSPSFSAFYNPENLLLCSFNPKLGRGLIRPSFEQTNHRPNCICYTSTFFAVT